ncbi:MAG TPA: segregation/condensation protein A [Methanothrix sp.]|nr:segregation/condensation protein A [Methanothrix sp.]HRW83411.1 segregation/condensation protein A [Methanothrix sp.]
MSQLSSVLEVPDLPEPFGLEPDPVQVLLDLARKGEIDPWDVDLAQVTEKFLERIEAMGDRDLPALGRTLLYASILLRMKSDSIEEGDEEPEDDLFDEFDDEPVFRRRTVEGLPAPPIRRKTRRPVTLDELIAELKRAENVAERKVVRTRERPEPTVEEAMERAHEEGIEDRIRSLRGKIFEMLGTADRVSFSDVGEGDILNYVSVLFMAGRREIWLEQESLFGELFIRRHPDGKGEPSA